METITQYYNNDIVSHVAKPVILIFLGLHAGTYLVGETDSILSKATPPARWERVCLSADFQEADTLAFDMSLEFLSFSK